MYGHGKLTKDLHDGGVGKNTSNMSLGFSLNLVKSDDVTITFYDILNIIYCMIGCQPQYK